MRLALIFRGRKNGKREVPINILWKLADFYDVSIDYLVGREKERKR